MLPEIKNIKTLRKSLDITQKELAARVGLTQSYITKIESGKSDAPYSTIKKIFDILEEVESYKKKKRIILAKDIMYRNIKTLKPEDTLKKAIHLMNRYDISQLPVIKNNNIIGSITKNTIPKLLSKGKKDISSIKVGDVIEEPFPIISEDSVIKIISEVLKSSHAVILTKKGKITGIITSHDLLKVV